LSALSDSYSGDLHDGEQTACDFPSTLRVTISERARWMPHKKQDMVGARKEVAATKGEPSTLDL
jgi:hypothetical protein